MSKKQKSKKQTHVTKKAFLIYAVSFSLFTIASLFGVLWIVFEHIKLEIDDPSAVRQSIIAANESLSDEAPNVPDNNTQYIPEMRLKFTTDQTSRIAYYYHEAHDNSPKQALITSTYIKQESSRQLLSYNTVNGFFAQIDPYQNCGRLYMLTYDNDKPDYPEKYSVADTVSLGDTNLVIWKNEDPLCRAATDHGTQGLLDALRSAEEY